MPSFADEVRNDSYLCIDCHDTWWTHLRPRRACTASPWTILRKRQLIGRT